MKKWQEVLTNRKFIVLDGGLATELEKKGCDLKSFLWSAKIIAERPDLIAEVHRDYFQAGADIATTATYQASFQGFAKAGYSKAQAEKLIRTGVEIAHEIREEQQALQLRPLLVAASVGSYGAFLADGSEYRGDYKISDQELMAFHLPRIKIFAELKNEGKVDLLAIETIPSLREIEVILQILKSFPELEAWISVTLKDAGHLSAGDPIEKFFALVNENPQIVAAGANCSPPELLLEFCETARPHAKKPLVAYPNSGETFNAVTKSWSGENPIRAWEKLSHGFFRSGARWIGGCCRTGPEEILAIAAGRDSLPLKERKIIRTFLSRRPDPLSLLVSLSTILLCFAVSKVYWSESAYAALLPGSHRAVFESGEIWRLFTAIFTHGDAQHLLSNSYMLGILVYFVFGHFGIAAFPVVALAGAAAVNALSLLTYRPDVLLVGASGLVYLLAGFWLTLFVAIERQRSFSMRLVRALGVGLMILFPTSFEAKTSYRTHGIGVAVGILLGGLYFYLNKSEIRKHERVKLIDV
jgi:homocysteine S-methyltransferase